MHYKEINLRAIEPEDLELLYEWENNDEYWSISNTLSPYSRYTLKLFIENSNKSLFETGQLRLMIDLLNEKVTIGTIDIFDFDNFNKRAGVGILIATEKHRHKGYATMALHALINYCFETLHLHQLFCDIVENNIDSIELFKNTGFNEIGIKKDWIKTSDGFLDVKMFQLLRKE